MCSNEVVSCIHEYSALTEELMEDNCDDMTEHQALQEASVREKSLWVDKYSPRSYVELLSDDVSA